MPARSQIIDGKKPCSRCKRWLSLLGFYRDSRLSSGYSSRCKQCEYQGHLNYSHQYYRTNRDRILRQCAQYRQTPQGKRFARREDIRQRTLHPEKYQARYIANTAIQSGALKRLPCECCGAKAEAHHDDYSKPLEVRWLCRLHHQQHHNKEGSLIANPVQPVWTKGGTTIE